MVWVTSLWAPGAGVDALGRRPVSAAEHAWHVPTQAVSQQTPSSEQNPVTHRASTVHGCPWAATHWCPALHASFAGQSPLTRHSTQLPAPSHSTPPMAQAAPAGAGVMPGTPAGEQVPTSHVLLDGGRLSTSTTFIVSFPIPSQVVSKQSPGASFVALAPAGAFAALQVPWRQTATRQAFAGCGHVTATMQGTPPPPPPAPVVVIAPPIPVEIVTEPPEPPMPVEVAAVVARPPEPPAPVEVAAVVAPPPEPAATTTLPPHPVSDAASAPGQSASPVRKCAIRALMIVPLLG
jgi:hypothetical protein